MSATPATFASPTIDERFLITEALGHGGQGRVVRAYDRLERREVALKLLRPDAAPRFPSPLAAEYAAWIRLRHPNVVRAYEIGYARSGPLPAGTPYLVLELVRGLPAHRALSPGAVAGPVLSGFARRVLRALGHVHAAGLVHRDLKPGNVLVARAGRRLARVKLTDFGLASESGRAGPAGRISGSLPYVAPEAILGLPLDGRADLYGLGILLFLLATGRLPLATRCPDRWLPWHLSGPPADPRRIRADVDSGIAELVSRLTARDRDARPPTAAEAESLLGPAKPEARRASASLRPADRARVRLAVDAARRAGRAVLRVPRGPAAAAAHAAELASIAAAFRLRTLRLTSRRGSRRSNLAQVVLALLVERGAEAQALVLRHGLGRGLPVSLLHGVPLWDPVGHDESAARAPRVRPAVARGVARFLIDEARRRLLILVVEGRALRDPLAAAVVERLCARAPGPVSASRRGGLVVALPTCARSRCRRTGST